MPRIDEYIYGDSCIFLAYFNKEPGRVEILDQLFEEIHSNGERKLVTSAFSIIEVAHVAREKYRLKLDPKTEEALDALWNDGSLLELVDFHENLARQARTLIRQATELGMSLKPADALHLVTAQSLGVSMFFTYDNLSKYASMVGFSIREPYVDQPRLIP